MFEFSEVHQMIRETVSKLAKDVFAPKASELDEKEQFGKENFAKLAELGLLGITIPEEYGGAGSDVISATIALEEMGAIDPGTALSYGAHSILCANNINENANEFLKKKYLPDLASGKKIGGMAITEPGAGSDALGIKTTARKDGNYYILNGSKTFITNGPVGDTFVVYAKTAPDMGKNGISIFIVEKDFPGFAVGKKLHKMGMRASPTSELYFEDCKVPAENLIGEENRGLIGMMRNLDTERVTLSGISLGITRASLEISLEYSQERKQFGKQIAEFQIIQDKLSEIATAYQTSWYLVYGAAQKILEGKRANMEAAMAKVFAAESATKSALSAIQILGGYGYTKDFPVERLARDAKLMEIGAGTSEIQRMVIFKELIRRKQIFS